MNKIKIDLPAMDKILLKLAEIDSKIESLEKKQSQAKRLLTTKEAADFLRITTRHLQNLRDQKRIGFVQEGRNVRFKPEHLEAYIEEYKISPKSNLKRVA